MPYVKVLRQRRDAELGRRFLLQRMESNGVIGARPERDPGGAIDRQRQDEAIVVIGVFPDEIHPPAGPPAGGAFRPEPGRTYTPPWLPGG